MLKNIRNRVFQFINNNRQYPLIYILSAGLYPLAYYYSSNFLFINSWEQFLYFVLIFIVGPVLVTLGLSYVLNKSKISKEKSQLIYAVINFTWLTYLFVIVTFGFNRKKILLFALACVFLLAFFLYKHLKKIIVFQFLMTLVVILFYITPKLYRMAMIDSSWKQQPDNIENVQFKKKPNVYFIQPDGYVSFSELNKPLYNKNNDAMELFLKEEQFTIYDNARSNYSSTLSTNAAIFSMKHHYYFNPKKEINEFYGIRKIINGDNLVVSIFKENNYKTFLILEKPYFMVNRTPIKYDYCNINYDEVSYFTRGFNVTKDVTLDLEHAIKNNSETNNFYFIEKIIPGHISTYKQGNLGKEEERVKYLEKLETADVWLKQIINTIKSNDANSLIIIAADHGGFVGYDYTRESFSKQTDRDLMYSLFSTLVAIKWPDNPEMFDDDLKTSVNLFRTVFSYLGEDVSYLNHLEPDESYQQINKGAPFGVYQLINERGEVVFKQYKK